MQIFVSVLPVRKTISLDVEPNHSIKTLKSLIQDKEGIPPDQQCLIYAGIELEDSYNLNDYLILANSTVHLILKIDVCLKTFTWETGDFGTKIYRYNRRCEGQNSRQKRHIA